MYQIIFYEKSNGTSEVKQYLFHLKARADRGNKDTRKTPEKELEQAVRNLKDYKERNDK